MFNPSPNGVEPVEAGAVSRSCSSRAESTRLGAVREASSRRIPSSERGQTGPESGYRGHASPKLSECEDRQPPEQRPTPWRQKCAVVTTRVEGCNASRISPPFPSQYAKSISQPSPSGRVVSLMASSVLWTTLRSSRSHRDSGLSMGWYLRRRSVRWPSALRSSSIANN